MDNNFQLLLHEPDEGVLVFVLRGELDLGHAGEVKKAVATALGSSDYRRLVFDLTRLSFMDSSGIHTLVDTHRKMKAAGGELKVVCASPNLTRIFVLTGLDQLLTIVPDRESALALVA